MLAASAAVLVVSARFATTYRGLTLGLWHHALHAGVPETRNLLAMIVYWLDFMERLTPDAEGAYDFHPTPQDLQLGPFDRGRLAYHRGDFAAAIADFEHHVAGDANSRDGWFWLAMASLRQAENENCLEAADAGHHHAGRARCSLPLLTPHDRDDLSRRAAAAFERLLDLEDGDDPLYRWLLNFSYMTAGGYPDEVPPHYLIHNDFTDHFYGDAAAATAARFRHLSFTDRAAELGVDTFDAGRGVAVEDFDGDGWLDLITAGAFDGLRYYANVGGTGFEDRTAAVGLAEVTQPTLISTADYDGDGRVDLFVARPFDRYLLLRNRTGADGVHFEDVTTACGLLETVDDDEIAATWVSSWADVDNDGDLDLFLAQWAFLLPFVDGLMARPRMDSKLFVNEGGHFTDASAAFGLADELRDLYFVGAAFGDVDGDGDADLYLSSPLRRTSVLYENLDGRRFALSGAAPRGESGFVTAMVDVDHDGRLDIFRSAFGDARTNTEQAVFGDRRHRSGHSTLLLQDAAGDFQSRHDLFGSDLPMATMGASYGDLDNDGCWDFYLGTGNPESWFVLPNLMYLGERQGSRCTGAMTNVSMLNGFGNVQKGHGIVFFDFDNDGDQDVYSALGGMWPGDRWPNQLFVNDSELRRSWIKIRLRGRGGNRFGVGARLTVVAVGENGEEIVRRYQMDAKTGFGSAPYLAHIGLLDAVAIRRVEVQWPGSQCRTSYPAQLGRLNVLTESLCRGQEAAG